MPIHLLTPHVSAQIGLGTALDDPAAVAKELIENSIDAGAHFIAVSVRGGGLAELRVADDGYGIPADELDLAFERHATSKLRTADELPALTTLGFRGEALHAIAAVAELACTTRVHGAASGVAARLVGGAFAEWGAANVRPGTTMAVRDLFFNRPERLAFLRTPQREAAAVEHVVRQYALARPDIAFTLKVENRSRLATPGTGELADAAWAVFGPEVAAALLEVNQTYVAADSEREVPEQVQIRGLVSPPWVTVDGHECWFVSVNGRAIAARGAIAAMLAEPYEGMLPPDCFPYIVLQIAMPPHLLDINVDAAKRELRYAVPLGRLVPPAIWHALRAAPPAPVQEAPQAPRWPDDDALMLPRCWPGQQPDVGASGCTLPPLRALAQHGAYLIASAGDDLYLVDIAALCPAWASNMRLSPGEQQAILDALAGHAELADAGDRPFAVRLAGAPLAALFGQPLRAPQEA